MGKIARSIRRLPRNLCLSSGNPRRRSECAGTGLLLPSHQQNQTSAGQLFPFSIPLQAWLSIPACSNVGTWDNSCPNTPLFAHSRNARKRAALLA
jgi:hypothetical protein